MSTIPRECFSIASVSISLRLKWIVKLKEIEALSSKAVSAVYSNLYKFNNVRDLGFCFCLEHPEIWFYRLSVKGSHRWSFEVMNPFILIEDRAYGLKPYYKQAFLSFFDATCIPDIKEYVEVHSVVNICPANPHLPYPDESFLSEVPDILHYESFPHLMIPSNCTNEKVIAFMEKGDFPSFSVDVAIQIISEAKIHKCNVLKVLCIEYLMRNVTEDSFEKILKVAHDLGLPHLERRCTAMMYFSE